MISSSDPSLPTWFAEPWFAWFAWFSVFESMGNKFYANIYSNYSPAKHSSTFAMACVISGITMDTTHTPFGMRELKKALAAGNSSSSGLDGIR